MYMEVDHFNPGLSGNRRNFHGNLVPAARLCNNTKRERWPTDEEQAKGIRFLNPYEEQDYGVHIYEDVATGKLIGHTPAGKWHIVRMALNCDDLVRARLRRTKVITKFTQAASISGADPNNKAIEEIMSRFDDVQETYLSIEIPRLPVSSSLMKK